MSIVRPCPYDEDRELCKYEIYYGEPNFSKCKNCSRAIHKYDGKMMEVKLTAKQYAMVSECIERVSANEREFDKDSEETLKEVAEKFKADYKELNKDKEE